MHGAPRKAEAVLVAAPPVDAVSTRLGAATELEHPASDGRACRRSGKSRSRASMEQAALQGLTRSGRGCSENIAPRWVLSGESPGEADELHPAPHLLTSTEIQRWAQQECQRVSSPVHFQAGHLMPRWTCVKRVASRMPGQDSRFRSMICLLRESSMLSGETIKAPTMFWPCGGRPILGSVGGLYGEHHGVILARPHNLTISSVQCQLVLPDSLALGGMTPDVEWVFFRALSLQDQMLVARWVQEGADSMDFAQASIAFLGRNIGSRLVCHCVGCAESIGS